MQSLPRVSIVMPFYNAASTLQACLESIQAQSFSDYEVILLLGLSKLGLAGLRAGLMVADPAFVRSAYNLQIAGSFFQINLRCLR